MTLHKSSPGIVEDESLLNAWMQLETQLYRRWQLLGLCNAKIGDRRVNLCALFDVLKF